MAETHFKPVGAQKSIRDLEADEQLRLPKYLNSFWNQGYTIWLLHRCARICTRPESSKDSVKVDHDGIKGHINYFHTDVSPLTPMKQPPHVHL